MHVNSYQGEIDEAFRKGIGELSETQEATIKKVVDELQQRVSDELHDSMKTYFMENLKDDICREAARVAERMLEDALSGSDDQIKNLFGFHAHYKNQPIYFYDGRHPRQWDLIDAIAARRPDVFINEKIEQQAAYIQQLETDLARNRQYCADNHAAAER